MELAPEAVRSDRDLERKHQESVVTRESAGLDATPALAGYLSAFGSEGSNGSNSHLTSPVMRNHANGVMRAVAMRSSQQRFGNHKTQQLFAQLRRSSVVQRPCSCGNTCASCQAKSVEELDESKVVQRQAATASAGVIGADESVVPSDSPGHPLDHRAREFMEDRFGRDFSDVRVHTDSSAAQSADALSADAYTTGRDIYFAAGKYAPASQDGQRLLAHELTHTSQQAESPRELRSALQISSPDDPLEQEADRVSQGVVSGEITAQISSGESVLARDKALTSGLEGPAAVIQRNSDAGVAPDAGSATDSSPHASPVGSTRFVTVGPSDESVTLFDDESTDRSVLEGYITVHGLKGARHRIFELQFTLSTIDADLADWSGVSPQRDALLERRAIVSSVLDAAKGAMAAIEKESEKFLNDFEQQSKVVLLAMLDISESKVMAEAEHYGIESSAMLEEVGASIDEIYSMAAKPKEGLTKAAKELAAKLRALSKKIMEEIKYLSYVGGSEDWAGEWMVSDVEGHKRWQQELDDADYDYMSARAKAVAAFPILASYATPKNRGTHYLDESADELEEINESSTGELALKLQNEIYDRLSDIQDTRHNLEEGDLKIWKLPSIVSGTKTAMDIQPGTLHDKLVDEHVEDVISDEGLIKMALAALALALGLLAAIPTGGGSLVLAGIAVTAAVGSATISAYVAYSDLKEYRIQSAASGTDFEKAQAISQDEPSLFWLAVSIVGAVVDIGAAVSAFGKLAKAAREVQEARRLGALGKITEEEAASSAATLDRLKKDAEAIQPGLGDKIEARLGKVAGEEARNAEHLATRWEEGLNPETRAVLEANADAKALYTEMDPAIRDLLSHCASICIIPDLTRRQYAQIKEIVYEHEVEEIGGLKQFFHFRRNDLDAAITELREAEDLSEIKALLEHTLKSSPIQAEEDAVSTWQRLQEAGVQTDSRADFIDKYRSGLRYDERAATWYNPVKGLKDTIPLNASAADALAKFKATEGFESFRQLLLDEKMITGDEDLVKAIEGMKTYRGRPVDAIRHAVKDLYREELIARMAHPNEAVMRLRYPHLPWKEASEDALRQASYQEMRRMTDALPSADKGNMFERWYKQTMAPGSTEHVKIDLNDLKALGSQEETARVIDMVEGDTIRELKRVGGLLGEHDLSQFDDNMLLIAKKFEVNGQKLRTAVYTFPIPEGVRANAKWMAEKLAAYKGTLTFEVFNSAGEVKILTKASDLNKPAFWTWLGVAKP